MSIPLVVARQRTGCRMECRREQQTLRGRRACRQNQNLVPVLSLKQATQFCVEIWFDVVAIVPGTQHND